MEQGLVENVPLINNVLEIEENRDFVLTRDNNLNVVAAPFPNPIISNIEDVEREQTYLLTRDNDENVSVVPSLPPLISNINEAEENRRYSITRDGNNNVVLVENEETITNLNEVEENLRYHITRRLSNLFILLDRSLQITPLADDIEDLFFAIRKRGQNYSLIRSPALSDYVFSTNELAPNSSFDVLGLRASRIIHVINVAGKIVRFGITHANEIRNNGLIDRNYRFELIINSVNRPPFDINQNNSRGSILARTREMDELNIFVNEGDSLGLRYVQQQGSNIGEYLQARVTVDTNLRNRNLNVNSI